MLTLFRDIFVVAQYELSSALRTRLLQVVLLGYGVTMFLGNLIFVEALSTAETQVAQQLGLPTTERPGTLLSHVTESEVVRAMLVDAIGSEGLVSRLIQHPLLAVWAGVVAMLALPIVMLAGTAGSLAGEVQSKSVRFLTLRTERLAIVLGKLLGQFFLAAAAAGVGVGVTVGVGQFLMVEQNPAEVGFSTMLFCGRGLLYALPFGALGLCVSQWVPSRNGARVLAIVTWIGCSILGAWIEFDAPWNLVGRALDMVRWFLPTTGWTSMWSASASELGGAAARIVILTLSWIALGFVRFARRDL